MQTATDSSERPRRRPAPAWEPAGTTPCCPGACPPGTQDTVAPGNPGGQAPSWRLFLVSFAPAERHLHTSRAASPAKQAPTPAQAASSAVPASRQPGHRRTAPFSAPRPAPQPSSRVRAHVACPGCKVFQTSGPSRHSAGTPAPGPAGRGLQGRAGEPGHPRPRGGPLPPHPTGTPTPPDHPRRALSAATPGPADSPRRVPPSAQEAPAPRPERAQRPPRPRRAQATAQGRRPRRARLGPLPSPPPWPLAVSAPPRPPLISSGRRRRRRRRLVREVIYFRAPERL